MSDRAGLPHGARIVQSLLDADTRAVPAPLRAVGDDAAFGMVEGDGVQAEVTVPRAAYTSPAVAARERDALWRRVWQMACREEQIPEVGDSVLYEAPGVSLIVVRAPEGIRALHNSCLHRGTQLRTQPGRLAELRCPFHGFTWRLDGSFAGMPCPWDFPHVEAGAFCLPEARVGTWGGFVFVTVDPATEELDHYLEILPAHFAPWDLGERVLVAHVVREVPCNWKVALEAFIESYHTVAVHPQLLKTSGDTQTEYDVYAGVRHVNRMITPIGIASEHVERPVAQQDIVDAMFLTMDDPDALVPEGGSARPVLAERTRRQLEQRTARDMGAVSDSEALDAIEYFVFPNFVPWAGYTTPLVYRFRPAGEDPARALMDVMLLEPVPAHGPRPAPAATRHLAEGQRWAEAPELGYMGRILDQDTATLGRIQRGLAGGGPDVVLSRYQESRIRHFHATLGDYLGP